MAFSHISMIRILDDRLWRRREVGSGSTIWIFAVCGLRLWKWDRVNDRSLATITIPERPLWSWRLRAVGKEGDELNTVDCLFGRDWSCQRNWWMKTTGRLSDWLMDHWRPTFDLSVTGLHEYHSWRNRNLLWSVLQECSEVSPSMWTIWASTI